MKLVATSRIADWLWVAAVSGAVWTGLFVLGVSLTGADLHGVWDELFGSALIVAVSFGFRPGAEASVRYRLVGSSLLFVASAIGFGRSIYVTQLALTAAGA